MGFKVLGEWDEDNCWFWMGANGCEYIAPKGLHQIFVYDCDFYPNPPKEVWQYHKRIETLNDFSNALRNSIKFSTTYAITE